MADALDSGSSGGNTVRVQVPFSASFISRKKPTVFRFLLIFLWKLSPLFVIV